MKAKVNERFSYMLPSQLHLEVIHQDGSYFQVRRNGKLFDIELLGYEIRTKRFELAVNGYIFKVKLEDELDEVIQKMSQISVHSSGIQVVAAPIPGLIKGLIKVEGDGVLKGEPVLVLEAMKMENTIQSPDGAAQLIYHVNEGDHVTKGQKLFTLMDEKDT